MVQSASHDEPVENRQLIDQRARPAALLSGLNDATHAKREIGNCSDADDEGA